MAALALALGVGPSDASAQFGLPKIPKLSKTGKKDAPPQAAKPQGPPPQVAAISPNSVPPGWEGDVILTGTNFSKTMKLRMQCGYQSVKTVKFMVESAERAVLSLKISPTSEEEKCTIVLEVPPEATAETGPTVEGTPQIVQVTGATFAIADSASYAKPFQACFLAEGDVPVMELMMKLSQAMQQSSQDPCKLLVSSASVKYASQGKTILDQPASAVKTVDQVLMMGNPIGVFRIVLTNGKIYNFFASGSQSSDDPLFEQIKRRLNK
jgi:hypothetical protein